MPLKKTRSLFLVGIFACLLTAACVGCQKSAPEVGASEPPGIPVSQPLTRTVTDFVDFTGRIDAPESVNIVPRVTGYLMSTEFREGAEVKQGDVLFRIDPRPYQAQYDQAEGQVLLSEARVKQAVADNSRAKELAKTPGTLSQQDLDRYQAAEEEANAAVQAAKASLDIYQLNLGYCEVRSPITGQISRYFMTPGNLVNQDQTQLTTIVSVDPMYIYFDMDESTLLRIRRAINEGQIDRYAQGEIPVYIAFDGDEGFPHEGKVNFVNNRVNSGTGSITVRGVLPNPKPSSGVRVITPGMYVRVHLPIGKPHDALLVIDRAIGSDQGLKYVYVVDSQNKVQQQRVQTGALEEDGLRVISAGLKPEDWLVVGAVQQVRPRMQIAPDREPMPTLGRPAAEQHTPTGEIEAAGSGASSATNSQPSTGSTPSQTPAQTAPASSAPR